MTNGNRFEQVFGVGQANLAIASCSWWDDKYIPPSSMQKSKYEYDRGFDDGYAAGYADGKEIAIIHVGYSEEECGYEK